MSTTFNLGFRVGSFIRSMFVNESPVKKDPVWTESVVRSINLAETRKVEMSKSKCYSDIVEVCRYQSIFLERVGWLIFQLEKDVLSSSEEASTTIKHIQSTLAHMYQNDACIQQAIENIHNIDLEFEEKLGYPVVTALLDKVKSVAQ